MPVNKIISFSLEGVIFFRPNFDDDMASFRCSQVFEKPFRGQEASERLITFFPATLLRVVR